MSFYNSRKIQKTRKKHFCNWCGESITQGESAHYNSGIREGDFVWGYFHQECQEAMNSKEGRKIALDGYTIGEFKRGTVNER